VQDGLVARYSFDTSTGTDDSGNGNTGSVLGGTSFDVGKVGTAANFDGTDDHIAIPSNDSFQFGTGNFAISLWVHWNNTSGYQVFTDGGYSSNKGVLIETDAGIKVRIYFGTQLAGLWDRTTSPNTRYHFVVTRTGNSLSVFVNGNEIGSPSTNSTSITKFSYLIGKYSGGEFFNGKMDDLRFYNRALSTGEIYELYASAQTLYQTGECNDTTATLHP